MVSPMLENLPEDLAKAGSSLRQRAAHATRPGSVKTRSSCAGSVKLIASAEKFSRYLDQLSVIILGKLRIPEMFLKLICAESILK